MYPNNCLSKWLHNFFPNRKLTHISWDTSVIFHQMLEKTIVQKAKNLPNLVTLSSTQFLNNRPLWPPAYTKMQRTMKRTIRVVLSVLVTTEVMTLGPILQNRFDQNLCTDKT
jgi:hypothetical protein